VAVIDAMAEGREISSGAALAVVVEVMADPLVATADHSTNRVAPEAIRIAALARPVPVTAGMIAAAAVVVVIARTVGIAHMARVAAEMTAVVATATVHALSSRPWLP
jgi:hypothetical protein